MGSIKRRINSRSRSVFSSRRLCRRHRGSHLHIVEGRRRRGRRRGRRAAGCGQTLRQRDRRAHAGGAHQTGAEESRGGRGGPGGRRRPEEKSPDLGVHLGHDAHSSHSRPQWVHQRLHRRREGERWVNAGFIRLNESRYPTLNQTDQSFSLFHHWFLGSNNPKKTNSEVSHRASFSHLLSDASPVCALACFLLLYFDASSVWSTLSLNTEYQATAIRQFGEWRAFKTTVRALCCSVESTSLWKQPYPWGWSDYEVMQLILDCVSYLPYNHNNP